MDLSEFGDVTVGTLEVPRFTLADVATLLAKLKKSTIDTLEARLVKEGVVGSEKASLLTDVSTSEWTARQAHAYSQTLAGTQYVLSTALAKIGKTMDDLPPMTMDDLTFLAARVLHVVADPTIPKSKVEVLPGSSTSVQSGLASTHGATVGAN